MGRHRAEPVGKRRDARAPKSTEGRRRPRRNPELLGWGAFLTGTSAVCLLWAEVPAGLAAGSAGLLLSAFLAAWYLSTDNSTTAGPSHAQAASRSAARPQTARRRRGHSHTAPASGEPATGEQSVPAKAAVTATTAVPARASASANPAVPAKRAVPVPAIPVAPAAVQEFLGLPRPRPASISADGTSRWTRTFGPPETGSLPLQPYVPARRAAVQTADPEVQDRRQRSHSSH